MTVHNRLRRQAERAYGARTSGDLLVNGPAQLWPGGAPSPVTAGGSGCDTPMVWGAGPGQGNSIGGSHNDMGYGYGMIGPNGPDEGNYPGPLPSMWWNNYGSGGGGLLPAVTRATQIITSPTVRNSWEITSGGGLVEEPMPSWIIDPMGARTSFGPGAPTLPVAHRLTGHDFWSTLLVHALWWGRGVMLFEVNDQGRPIAGSFQLMNPFLVHEINGYYVIAPETEGQTTFDFDGRVKIAGKTYQIKVMRGLPPHLDGDFFGGVLIRHAKAFGIGTKIQTYEAQTFNTGVPSGVLQVTKPNFTQEASDNLQRIWSRAHGGDRRGVAVLTAGVSFSPISLNPVETDLSKIKQSNLVDLAHAFGISASWMDTSSGASDTYANLVDRRRDLVDHTLAEWGESLMMTLDTILPAGQLVRVRWRDYTKSSFGETLKQAMDGLSSGILTKDEARDLVGYMPIEVDGGSDV